ncbi:hypothetical protein E2C01_000755 [Portunus trituberculatus]|uniref:Uncharacterized protein n=1 Tax=Portunus trituberculatus TaxID=210409 RepID=A0A5B7CG00_PORTR|nr:hypothetical protein [Portunus trituberculatus]
MYMSLNNARGTASTATGHESRSRPRYLGAHVQCKATRSVAHYCLHLAATYYLRREGDHGALPNTNARVTAATSFSLLDFAVICPTFLCSCLT